MTTKLLQPLLKTCVVLLPTEGSRLPKALELKAKSCAKLRITLVVVTPLGISPKAKPFT